MSGFSLVDFFFNMYEGDGEVRPRYADSLHYPHFTLRSYHWASSETMCEFLLQIEDAMPLHSRLCISAPQRMQDFKVRPRLSFVLR